MVRLVDAKNEQLGNGFAPNFVYSNVPDRFNPLTYPEGRAPRTAREIAIDKGTAERKGIELGDSVGVAGDRVRRALPRGRHQRDRRHVVRRAARRPR